MFFAGINSKITISNNQAHSLHRLHQHATHSIISWRLLKRLKNYDPQKIFTPGFAKTCKITKENYEMLYLNEKRSKSVQILTQVLLEQYQNKCKIIQDLKVWEEAPKRIEDITGHKPVDSETVKIKKNSLRIKSWKFSLLYHHINVILHWSMIFYNMNVCIIRF